MFNVANRKLCYTYRIYVPTYIYTYVRDFTSWTEKLLTATYWILIGFRPINEVESDGVFPSKRQNRNVRDITSSDDSDKYFTYDTTFFITIFRWIQWITFRIVCYHRRRNEKCLVNVSIHSITGATLKFDVELINISDSPPTANVFKEIDANDDKQLSREEVRAMARSFLFYFHFGCWSTNPANDHILSYKKIQ